MYLRTQLEGHQLLEEPTRMQQGNSYVSLRTSFENNCHGADKLGGFTCQESQNLVVQENHSTLHKDDQAGRPKMFGKGNLRDCCPIRSSNKACNEDDWTIDDWSRPYIHGVAKEVHATGFYIGGNGCLLTNAHTFIWDRQLPGQVLEPRIYCLHGSGILSKTHCVRTKASVFRYPTALQDSIAHDLPGYFLWPDTVLGTDDWAILKLENHWPKEKYAILPST